VVKARCRTEFGTKFFAQTRPKSAYFLLVGGLKVKANVSMRKRQLHAFFVVLAAAALLQPQSTPTSKPLPQSKPTPQTKPPLTN
jgi:hypothetical protein